MNDDKLIYVGIIIGAHGIKGEVKVKSFTSPIDNIATMQLQDTKGHAYSLKIMGRTKDILICRISNSLDRNTAEAMHGLKLFVMRSNLPKVAESEYYAEDLYGIAVCSTDKEVIGKVVAVYNFGAGDIIEIELLHGVTEMFPFTKEIFPEITKDYVTFIPPQLLILSKT